MSQFYDQASLVMVPSGYKNGKLYSQKPLSTSGELSFSRASNATRVVLDASGQQRLEKVRTNLLTYSNDFSNAAWIKSDASVTSGQSGYDGTSNAWKLTPNTSNSAHYTKANIVTTGLLTFSVYVKPDGYNFVLLYAGGYGGTFFDISTGTIGGNLGPAPSATKIEAAGNGFYRCSITVPLSADVAIFPANTISNYVFSGNGTSGILIQSAQYETGDIATDPITTLGSAVSVGPVSGLPRLDYSGGASCPSLLLEPQRTNLALWSEQMDNASWIKLNGAVTANAAVSPDGYTNADKFVPNTTSGVHALRSNLFNQSATAAHSWFVKADGYSKVAVRESELVGNYASFNLVTGTLISTSQTGSIVNYGNGWYRLTLVDTTTGVNAQTSIVVLPDSYTTGDPIINWSGDGTKGVLAYGASVELGAYATSYIPTLSSAVTRVADAASKTGISSLIGQTEGTLFVEYNSNITEDDSFFLVIDDGTANNRIVLYSNVPNKLALVISAGGVLQAVIPNIPLASGTNKFAVAYANNDIALYLNGVSRGTDNTATIPATSALRMGTDHTGAAIASGKGINQALVFKTRLSNADLATLTTL